jgi:outer membrane autotransporter protein
LTRENWTYGAGFAWEDFDSDGYGNAWQNDGDTKQFGGIVKYQLDETLLASSLLYGRTSGSIRRLVDVSTPVFAKSDQELSFYGIAFDVDHRFGVAGLTLTPLLQFGALQVDSDGDTERGAGALGLAIESTDETYSWLRPGLELSYRFDASSAWSLHPYLRASLVHYLNGDETSVDARLIGAPPGAGTMSIASGLGQDQWLYEAGLDFMTVHGYTVQLRYERTSADDFDVDQASLRFSVPF